MPTAAKLVAALFLALTGFVASQAILPFLPEGTQIGWLVPVSVLIPVVCGWRAIGRLVGKSYWAAFNTGIYGVSVSVFFVLLTFASAEMIERSLKLRYDGPMDAITSMFGIAVEYGSFMLNVPVLTTLIAGAAIAGIGAEWTSRRWA